MSGTIGVYSFDESFFGELSRSLYSGLVTINDRGESGTGICLVTPSGQINFQKGFGKVDVAIPREIIKIPAMCGIGNTRYAREKFPRIENTQPVKLNTPENDRYECYVSTDSAFIPSFLDSITQELEKLGYKCETLTGAEKIGATFLMHLKKTGNISDSCAHTIEKLDGGGGYSSTILLKDKTKGLDGIILIALRDSYGVKPFYFGERDKTFYINSETYWLEKEGVEKIEEVKRGGGVIISKNGLTSFQLINRSPESWAFCNFDPVYHGSPFTRILFPLGSKFYKLVKQLKDVNPEYYDKPTYLTLRNCLGLPFPESYPEAGALINLFVSSPNSGNGVTDGLGIGYGKPVLLNAVKKSSAVGKTFQTPDEVWRNEIEVYVKFEVDPDVLKGKRIGVGEDSIVRGSVTTGGDNVGHVSRRGGLLNQLKTVGRVTETYVFPSYPPYAFNCARFFGKEEHLAAQGLYGKPVEEANEKVGNMLGVPVYYQPLQNIYDIFGPSFCRGCADGRFPFIKNKFIPDSTKRILEEAGVF